MLKLDQHVLYVLTDWDKKENFPIVCSSFKRLIKVVEFLKKKNYGIPKVYCYYRSSKISGFAWSEQKTILMQIQIWNSYAKRENDTAKED